MTEWANGGKVEVISGAHRSHGGPCENHLDSDGRCRVCGGWPGGAPDEVELMEEGMGTKPEPGIPLWVLVVVIVLFALPILIAIASEIPS